jgi:hypothetical protein
MALKVERTFGKIAGSGLKESLSIEQVSQATTISQGPVNARRRWPIGRGQYDGCLWASG